jgi:hypothetical protein
VQDCRHLQGEAPEPESLFQEERQKAAEFPEHQRREIMENFDPKAVKFLKKYKIVLAEGVADELL